MPEQNLDAELNKLKIDRSRKRRPRRRWGKWVVIALLGAGVVLGMGYYNDHVAPLQVKVARATRVEPAPGGGTPAVTASGYVIPRKNIDVSSKVIGRVREVLIERGQRVKAGDVLIRVEDEEYRAQVHQAEAALAAAEARLAELRAGSRPQEISASRESVRSAQSTLDNARREVERFAKLREEGVVSQQEYDLKRTEFEVAEANLKNAQENFKLVDIGPREEQIRAAEADAGQARASLEFARTQLDYTVIRAPIDGTILEKVAEEGELVTNTDFGGSRVKSAVVSMADLADLQVEIDLNENDLAKVALRQKCVIELDSLPGVKLKGVVDEIAPQADRQKGTVQVKVRIDDPNEEVRPEVNARVTFLTNVPENPTPEDLRARVYISPKAVERTSETTRVWLAVENAAQSRAVTLGGEAPDGLEVTSGLEGGELLITESFDKLRDGRKIEVVTPGTIKKP